MPRPSLLVASALGLVFVLLTGCGSSNVDTGKIERELRKHFAQAAKIDPGSLKVDCPPDEEAKAGRTFTCTVNDDGRRRTVLIRLDAGGDYTATLQSSTTP